MHMIWKATTLLAVAAAVAVAQDATVSPRARNLHTRMLVVDTHADTTQRMIFDGFDLGHRDAQGHVDIPRLREGGIGAQFFSIWVPSKVTGSEAVKRALRQIDAVREQARLHSRDLALATTAEEIQRAHRAGKIAVLMGVEGGHMMDDDLGVLRMYAALGVRYLTLTHFLNTNWADSSTDTPKHNGLTDFGRSVVQELNRLGVMVDISHVSDKTFYDVLAVTKAPVLASHSSSRAISDHPRNMSDDMLRALSRNGGVVMINYVLNFLSQEYRTAASAQGLDVTQMSEMLERECGDNEACQTLTSHRLSRQWMNEGKLPRVTWEKIIEHIDHAVKVAGVDHVGLGSDFDGADMPFGMDDASQVPRITEGLLRKGYSERDIGKILGGNILHVMEQVEEVSRQWNAAESR